MRPLCKFPWIAASLGKVAAARTASPFGHLAMTPHEKAGFRRKMPIVSKGLANYHAPRQATFLDFAPGNAVNPATPRKDVLFDPAARPLRPEVNVRQRDAPSGAKLFG
jgi:hypothetical protein